MSEDLDIELDDEQDQDREVVNHFNKYLISSRIDYHLTSKAPEVQAAVDYLCEEIGYDSDRAKTHMRMLICNLYLNYDNWDKRYTHLCLSKDTGKHKHMSQYNHFRINYDPLYKCIIYLIMNRYIRRKKGYFNLDHKDGFETRLIARGKLIRLLEEKFSVRFHMIHPYPDQQTIIVRKTIKRKLVTFKRPDGSVRKYKVKVKRPVEYPENSNIIGWRSGIKRYIELLERSFVDLDTYGYEPKDGEDEIVDLSKKRVRRIFTDTTRLGGRFYGGWHQQIRKELRKHIVINGRPTVEIDYAGLHIHILYALRDKRLGVKEPYIVPKHNDPGSKRSLYKRLMLAGVNAETPRGCIKAVMDEVKSNPDDYPPVTVSEEQFKRQLQKMLEELKVHHSDIAKDINSGKGLKAQFIDSEIAYKVIIKMTDKGIPVLCVHDSFICRDMDVAEVKHAMVQAYIEVIHRETQRRKNRIKLTADDVRSEAESIIDSLEEYKYVKKHDLSHALNPVFRKSSSYYERYIDYLASGRTKSTFNTTLNVSEEVSLSRVKSANRDDVRESSTNTGLEPCDVTLLQRVWCKRFLGCHEGSYDVTRAMATYLGGFSLSGQIPCGFSKLQKSDRWKLWLGEHGDHRVKSIDATNKWLTRQKSK